MNEKNVLTKVTSAGTFRFAGKGKKTYSFVKVP